MYVYIIMVIIVLVLGVVIQPNKTQKRKKIYLIISFGCMTIVAALRKYIIGIDLEYLYKPVFDRVCSLSWSELTSSISLEVGYLYFCKMLSMISSNSQILIIVTSLITVPVYGWFIYKNSKNVVISTTLYIFLNVFFMSMNIVRQEIAVAIILVAYEFIKNKKNVKAIILILLATSVHASAIICLIFIPLYGKKFKKNYLVYSIFLLIFLLISYKALLSGYSWITNILGISNNKDYSSYLESDRFGDGIINLNSISKCVLSLAFYAVGFYYLVYLDKDNNSSQKQFYVFMTMFYMIIEILSLRMVIISRLVYYFLPFQLLIIPESMNMSEKTSNKKIILTVMYFFVILKYLYVYIYLADDLFGVMPYKFFWQ